MSTAEKKNQLDFAQSKDSIPYRFEETGTLRLFVLGTFFLIASLIFAAAYKAYLEQGITSLTLCVISIAVTLVIQLIIQAAIIRWACRADRVIEHCKVLELYLSLLLAHIHKNKCDMCGKIKHPTQLELLDTGKIICRPCKEKLLYSPDN